MLLPVDLTVKQCNMLHFVQVSLLVYDTFYLSPFLAAPCLAKRQF